MTAQLQSLVDAQHGAGQTREHRLGRGPLAHARGAPANEGLRWREIIDKIRGQFGSEPIIQINHPRPVPAKPASPITRTSSVPSGWLAKPLIPILR